MKHLVKIFLILFLFITSFCVSSVKASVDDVNQAPILNAEYSIENENSYCILNSIKQDFEISSLPLKKNSLISFDNNINSFYNFEFCLLSINQDLISNNIDNKSSYIAWGFNPRAP